VIDTEGRQRGELTVLARDPGNHGAEDYAPLGTAPDTEASVLRALAAAAADGAPGSPVTPSDAGSPGATFFSGADVIGALAGRGLDPVAARAVGLFGEWSPAGETAVFVADRPVTAVDAANPPSDLVLEVRRTQPRVPREPQLPPPLADPVLDLRVDTATALAYQV